MNIISKAIGVRLSKILNFKISFLLGDGSAFFIFKWSRVIGGWFHFFSIENTKAKACEKIEPSPNFFNY